MVRVRCWAWGGKRGVWRLMFYLCMRGLGYVRSVWLRRHYHRTRLTCLAIIWQVVFAGGRSYVRIYGG